MSFNNRCFRKERYITATPPPDLIEGRGVCKREKPLGIKELRIEGSVCSVKQVSERVRISKL